jgi:hypothetical protein
MIGRKMQDAMNEQIKNELESAYIYLSMAAYFHSLGLDGMAMDAGTDARGNGPRHEVLRSYQRPRRTGGIA